MLRYFTRIELCIFSEELKNRNHYLSTGTKIRYDYGYFKENLKEHDFRQFNNLNYDDLYYNFIDVGDTVGQVDIECFKEYVRMKSIETKGMYEDEESFMKELRKLDLKYTDENVIILGELHTPIYLKFIASLGKNFSFVPSTEDIKLDSIFICVDNIGDFIKDFPSYEILKQIDRDKITEWASTTDNTQIATKQQIFILEQFEKSLLFLKSNPRIIITVADKGGKAVIAPIVLYYSKQDGRVYPIRCPF